MAKVKHVQWTLETGIEIARAVEKVVEGLGYHAALGGGVLMKGTSEHDLDIFIYPAKTTHTERSPIFVLDELCAVPIIGCYLLVEYHEDDTKMVFACKTPGGKRIDIFFVR